MVIVFQRELAMEGIVRLTAEDAIGRSVPHTSLMHTSLFRYHRHRFPAEIISHSVWLYFRFALSFRDVEEMLAMRGVSLSYETVRGGRTRTDDLGVINPTVSNSLST
jgi:hypothetical protein